ncbi:DUF6011 domain-containing protein [Rhodoplanes sp. TEM]|uniref:DUF6011 domain-containing protein n=1 Tax=Rhodoplanes tepidamans TaxID=200616 RepID=A0ABT5J557_RHOTP|nr:MULTISPECIES: DUF6011 domain-containing protein [Rhodoplanes]MDC7784783.1 DUF6011 domain-containing protein [Rhodoplanes tepidamans]MDC7982250.1 DUF6011 domain-containing protein [Rhodoplanes sp. TEM]MDQ0356257.1 hypothetical protein [Rhodoplanes tepidamans]
MASLNDLTAALPRLSPRDQEFARSLLNGAARFGSLSMKQGEWVKRLVERANAPRPTPVQVGDLSSVIALFDRAGQHLRRPAIVLNCQGLGNVRLNVAGQRARVPGSLNVTDDGPYESRRFYGRIHRDGTFEPSRASAPGLVDYLIRFARDPAGVAAEHGLMTGNCCFCRRTLTDERSTAVGYGPTCAEHYGLPWGSPRA